MVSVNDVRCFLRVILLSSVFQTGSANLAYMQPTWQSTSNDNGEGKSWLAVDGNTNPKFSEGSCSHTDNSGENNPWWAVDLGGVYKVKWVTLYNRDSYPYRLHNFNIGVTSTSPDVLEPSDTNYQLCGYYPNKANNKTPPINMTCSEFAVGRYVVVQVFHPNGYVCLCEVVIDGTAIPMDHGMFMFVENTKLNFKATSTLTSVSNRLYCAEVCIREIGEAFTYNKDSGECQVFKTYSNNTHQQTPATGWDLYLRS